MSRARQTSKLCSFCRSLSTHSTSRVSPVAAPTSVNAVPEPSNAAVVGNWPFELPSEISNGPLTRSFIFDEPINWQARSKSRKRLRRDAFNAAWKAAWTAEQVQEWERWWADPWFKMQKSPIRDCVVTKQKLPMALLVNFKKALSYPAERRAGVKYKPEIQVLPDRVEHPRYTQRKRGFGFWVLCNQHVLNRLGDPGPHSRFVKDGKAGVPPDLTRLVYIQLVQRIVQEFEVLRDEMRSKRPRTTMQVKRDPRLALSKSLTENVEVLPKIISRCTVSDAEQVRADIYSGREAVAFLDIHGMGSGRTRKQKQKQAAQLPESKAPDVPQDSTQVVPSQQPQNFVDESDTEAEQAGTPISSRPTPSEWDDMLNAQIPDDYHIPMVKTPTTEAPLYTLKDLLPHAKQVQVRRLIAEILAIESRQRARHRTGQKQTEDPVGEKASSVLVLSTYPRSAGGQTRRGDLGTDLAIAFWRLRLFLGEGWEGFFVDIKGRRV